MTAKLFQPVKIGDIELKNRIVMGPLTRCRADTNGNVPVAIMAEYYRQRASAGLIISEATQVCPEGQGYWATPGMYTDAQVEGWKPITQAVHEEGGKIVAQLWHVGRISHQDMQPEGKLPVAPSAVNANTKVIGPNGLVDTPTPRALELSELPGIVESYRHAAECAKRAGFDGVEVHAANGYLLDEFLRDGCNQRTDAYGGSPENRARLVLEVIDAVIGVWGAGRVGIRLCPVSKANNLTDSNPQPVFEYLVKELDKRGIAYLHFIEGNTQRERDMTGFDFAGARKMFRGTYIANNGYTREMAIDAIESGWADAVCIGRPFISNPDLVARFEKNIELAPQDRNTFYTPGAKGYTDYPKAG